MSEKQQIANPSAETSTKKIAKFGCGKEGCTCVVACKVCKCAGKDKGQ